MSELKVGKTYIRKSLIKLKKKNKTKKQKTKKKPQNNQTKSSKTFQCSEIHALPKQKTATLDLQGLPTSTETITTYSKSVKYIVYKKLL